MTNISPDKTYGIYHVQEPHIQGDAFKVFVEEIESKKMPLVLCWGRVVVTGYPTQTAGTIADHWKQARRGYLREQDKNHPAFCPTCKQG